MPERPPSTDSREKWGQVWREQGTYTFDRTATRDQVFDRHPATDRVRFAAHGARVLVYPYGPYGAVQGMRGFAVFYPIGWDDNGLPTEKKVQNYYGVRGDAHLPHVEATSRRTTATCRASRPPTSSRSRAVTSSSCATS